MIGGRLIGLVTVRAIGERLRPGGHLGEKLIVRYTTCKANLWLMAPLLETVMEHAQAWVEEEMIDDCCLLAPGCE